MERIEVFSELKLFVCTYVAKLGNICINFEELTHLLCNNLSGNILAINSNYGHASQVGYEHFIKKIKKDKHLSQKGRIRKIQGDGTCFNSAIEPVIKINDSGKYYFIKCFPSTGETQIPGVIENDLSDGHNVLVTFIDFLNGLNLSDKIDEKIYICSEGPKMLNYKFKLNIDNNSLINLLKLSNLLLCSQNPDLNDTWLLIDLPYNITEIKSSIDDIKVSFRFQTSDTRAPRINIFQGGKVNILGSESAESSINIYKYLNEIFILNWNILVRTRPVKDPL
jgi:hypothetical protein